MTGRVVGEGGLGAFGDGEGDIAAISHTVCAVIFIPALVHSDFCLVCPGRNADCLEGENAVAVRVLQPGGEAIRLPITGTANFVLKVAGHVGNCAVDAVRYPAGPVVKVEINRAVCGHREWNVCAAAFSKLAEVDVPTAVERNFVFVVTGRQFKAAIPQLIRLPLSATLYS